jgi:hypothetical protein
MDFSFMYIVGGYVVSCFIGVFFVNFLSHGFVKTLLYVKAGRGARVMVKIYSITGVYFSSGTIDGTDVLYKPRGSKDVKRVTVAIGSFNRLFNMPLLEVDEGSNAVKNPDFSIIEGFDAQKADLMVEKAILLPKLEKGNLLVIVLVVVIVILLAVAFLVFRTVKLQEAIAALNVVQGGNLL